MKTISQNIILLLVVCGVFGADAVKSLSVMEGDYVTLNPDLTEMNKYWQILWRFGEELIAEIDEDKSSYKNGTDGSFRDRLQLDSKTGSLTITNMRMKHSGLYKLEAYIRSSGKTDKYEFSVAVYESPAVIDAGEAEMKTVSVMEGDSVPLQTDDTELHGDELIVWRFGDEGKLIAKCDIEAKSSPLYNTDERFRDRLKLDEKTGSLTITNTRTTDTALYRVKISSSKQTSYKKFTVIVSDNICYSAEAVIRLVVSALMGVAAVAAVVVLIYDIRSRKVEQERPDKIRP